MNRVSLSIDAQKFLALWASDFTVPEFREAFLAMIKEKPKPVPAEADGEASSKLGRPFKSNHVHFNQAALKATHTILFTQERISDDPNWANASGVRPTKFSEDQTGMDHDEIRLNNGIVAVLSDPQSGLPPLPRLD